MIKMFTKKRRKGFTLIELVVVIAILGILAAIAIPRLGGFTQTAKIKADMATFNTIDKSIAIGVADGTLKAGNVTWNVGTGAIAGSAGGTAAETTAKMANLVEGSPKLVITTNGTVTWTIGANGDISASHFINEADGVLTAVPTT